MTFIRGFLPGLNRKSNLDLKPVPWIFLGKTLGRISAPNCPNLHVHIG